MEAAAEVYFGVHAKDLQPQQAALLAGMVQNPTTYDPIRHPKTALERRTLVLAKLLQQGYIDAFEYRLADSKPLLPRGRPIGFPPEKKTIANYFVDYVRQQLINLYGRQKALGGGLRVYTTLNPRMQRLALKAVRATLPKRRPEAALVAINPPTGEVKAMVGGRDYTNTVYGKFNLATEAVRQPGSSFKIFVLLAALEEGILPQTQFDSHKLTIELPGRAVWSVQNDEGAYRGLIPLTTATTFSDNTVFAQLALRIGTERIRRVAHLMGIARPIGADPAIALGGLRHCCTPIEMALAYSTLANEGVRVTGSLPVRRPGPGEVPDPTLTPIAIRRVEDASGHVIDRNKPQKAQVVSRESALTAIAMLRSVIRIGTAHMIWGFPRPGGRQDRHDRGLRRRLVRRHDADADDVRLERLPDDPRADGQAVPRRAGVRRHLPRAALAGVHAAGAGGHEGARLARAGRGRGRRGAHRSRDRPARRAQLPARALGRDGLRQDAEADVALHGHGDPDARGDEPPASTRRRSRSTAPGCCPRSSRPCRPRASPPARCSRRIRRRASRSRSAGASRCRSRSP